MSLFLESIQQSPIDLELSDDEDDHELSGEEVPLSPPIETPLIEERQRQSHCMRLWKCREWISQLNEENLVTGDVVISASESGVVVRNRSLQFTVSLNGLDIVFPGQLFHVYEQERVPSDVRELYLAAQGMIESWRSRVVRLSMETDEVECSLMDDVYPPRTFLAEYKLSVLLKALKLQGGVLYISTLTRTVSVPISILEDEANGKIGRLITSIAPELSIVDIDSIYEEFVQLRSMSLEEDKRMRNTQTQRSARGQSADISTIDITVSGG